MTFRGFLDIQGADTFDSGIRFVAQVFGAAQDRVYLLGLQEDPIRPYFRANVDVNWPQNTFVTHRFADILDLYPDTKRMKEAFRKSRATSH